MQFCISNTNEIFWDENFPKTDSLPIRGTGKVSVHFTFPRPHMWDSIGYVVVVVVIIMKSLTYPTFKEERYLI